MLKYISFSELNNDRNLIMKHENFKEELLKAIKKHINSFQFPETVMYAYEKSGKFLTIYHHIEDMKDDRRKIYINFEKEPRIDEYLDEVINNINIYEFEEIEEFNTIKVKKIWKENNEIYMSFI